MLSNHLSFKHDTTIQYSEHDVHNESTSLDLDFIHVLSLSKDMYSVSCFIRLIYLPHMFISNKHIFQGCMSYFLNLSSEVSFPTKMECYCHMLYDI